MTGLQLWQLVAGLCIGVLTATVLVLAHAVWERRARQTPGRHRPETVTPLNLAAAPADGPYAVVDVDWSRSIDDWTADLPTAELRVVTAADLADHYDDITFAIQAFAGDSRRHTSPSETARLRWGVECPIFAGLAQARGYDPIRGFEAFDTARAVA